MKINTSSKTYLQVAHEDGPDDIVSTVAGWMSSPDWRPSDGRTGNPSIDAENEAYKKAQHEARREEALAYAAECAIRRVRTVGKDGK